MSLYSLSSSDATLDTHISPVRHSTGLNSCPLLVYIRIFHYEVDMFSAETMLSVSFVSPVAFAFLSSANGFRGSMATGESVPQYSFMMSSNQAPSSQRNRLSIGIPSLLPLSRWDRVSTRCWTDVFE